MTKHISCQIKKLMGEDVGRLSRQEIDHIISTVTQRLQLGNVMVEAVTEALTYLTDAVRGDIQPTKHRTDAARLLLDMALAMQKLQRQHDHY